MHRHAGIDLLESASAALRGVNGGCSFVREPTGAGRRLSVCRQLTGNVIGIRFALEQILPLSGVVAIVQDPIQGVASSAGVYADMVRPKKWTSSQRSFAGHRPGACQPELTPTTEWALTRQDDTIVPDRARQLGLAPSWCATRRRSRRRCQGTAAVSRASRESHVCRTA